MNAMTIPLAPPEHPATAVAESKKVSVNAQSAASPEHFAEGVNPALETSKWALKVCSLPVVHTRASDSMALQELDLVSLNDEGIKSAARYVSTL